MIGVEFDTRKIVKAINGLKKMDSQIIPSIDKAVGRSAAEGKRFIVKKTPRITGNLRKGFQMAHLGPTIWFIFNKVVYAPFIEYGERTLNDGKTIKRKKGPAEMVKGSIAQIQKRVNVNIETALDVLTKWRVA